MVENRESASGDGRRDAPVALVHGLFMHPIVMMPLAYRLRRCGFSPHSFGYRSTRKQFSEHVSDFDEWLMRTQRPPYRIAGHSMGALLAMAVAARRAADGEGGRIVALTPPFRGSATGRSLRSSRVGRLLLGGAADLWEERLPPPVPFGWNVSVVRGTKQFGAGTFLARLDGPHDGTVLVSEMDLPGAKAEYDLAVTHTGVLFSRAAAELVCSHFEDR